MRDERFCIIVPYTKNKEITKNKNKIGCSENKLERMKSNAEIACCRNLTNTKLNFAYERENICNKREDTIY